MGRPALDKTGMRIGSYVVDRIGSKQSNGAFNWFARCIHCNAERKLPIGAMKLTKSCSTCYKKQVSLAWTKIAETSYLEAVGKAYGKLTVLDVGFKVVAKNLRVTVLCSCGKTQPFVVRMTSLKTGNTTSCGCGKKETLAVLRAAKTRKKLTNEPFDRAYEQEKHYAEIAEVTNDVLPMQE